MTCHVSVSPRLPGVQDADPTPRPHRTQRVSGIVLLVALVVLDQSTKAWAWRHLPGSIINRGSTTNMGGSLNDLFSGPVSGALLDFVNCGLLCLAVLTLMRTRRPAVLFVSGVGMIAGWGSNLADRLGMHSVTAPGSVRGAVDFLPAGEYHYNVADLFIVGATITFCAAVIAQPNLTSSIRSLARARWRLLRPPRRVRVRTVTVVLAIATALSCNVAIGAGTTEAWTIPPPGSTPPHLLLRTAASRRLQTPAVPAICTDAEESGSRIPRPRRGGPG
jgi:lipoprotein signal peptidase